MNQKNGKHIQVIWTEFASEMLKEIFLYHEEVASNPIAHKIIAKVFSSTKQLEKYPESGQVEETLKKLNEGHRYLISGNYKIIYKKIPEGVLITDIFDTRQDPSRIQG